MSKCRHKINISLHVDSSQRCGPKSRRNPHKTNFQMCFRLPWIPKRTHAMSMAFLRQHETIVGRCSASHATNTPYITFIFPVIANHVCRTWNGVNSVARVPNLPSHNFVLLCHQQLSDSKLCKTRNFEVVRRCTKGKDALQTVMAYQMLTTCLAKKLPHGDKHQVLFLSRGMFHEQW
jgi:hypothetical protein